LVHVFVSGCYDVLHAGHLAFFEDARALGDKLTVCFASDEVLFRHKGCRSAIPESHKHRLLQSLRMVDEVVVGRGTEMGLDFVDHFRRLRPSILAATDDDCYADVKRTLCAEVGAKYRQLPKRVPCEATVSSTDIRQWIRLPIRLPLRVDFAGGWLDVPRLARQDAYVVNCAISPLVSLADWPFAKQAGLGGSSSG
jgi:cytidyltransferase-like protein